MTRTDVRPGVGRIDEDVDARGRDHLSRLLRGGLGYVSDVAQATAGGAPDERTLWARVVRSPLAHARLRGLDVRAALALPGVHAVITARDLVDVPHIPVRKPEPALDGALQPVLAVDRVRYVGEPVAVVIADDAALAEDAAELVELDLEPLPIAATVDHVASAAVWPDREGGLLAAGRVVEGNIDDAFERAAVVVTGRWTTPRQTGLPLEPRGIVAEWNPTGAAPALHIWGPTKYVHVTRRVLASSLGLPESQVVVHRVDVGGMFGVRGEIYSEDVVVPWAARRLGRRVAWLEDRTEHLRSINHSRQQDHEYALAVAADGTFLGYRDAVRIDAGAYARPIGSRPVDLTLEGLPGPYRWPALEARVEMVATHKTPIGTMRGPAVFETTFVRERAIDEAAVLLGIDPVELRRRNLLTRADLPHQLWSSAQGHAPVYDDSDYAQVLDAVVEHLDSGGVRETVERRRADGELVGLGIALYVVHSGNGVEESVTAELRDDGVVVVGTGGTEVGQGLTATVVDVVCAELGIPEDRVLVSSGDSRAHTEGRGTFGSRSTIFVGGATHSAMGLLKNELLTTAAGRWGVAPEAVTLGPDGARCGARRIPWADLGPVLVTGRHRMEHATWGCGAHAAVVSVDGDTGVPTVERLVVAYDCGRALNPERVRAQLIGASVAALGGTLTEELRYDDEAQPLTSTLMDYVLPRFADVPTVEALVVETGPVSGNPLGVRGAGEAGVFGVGAAVANAVADAVGRRACVGSLRDLPIRPAAVTRLLDDLMKPDCPGDDR